MFQGERLIRVSSGEPSLAERARNSQILSGNFNIDFSREKSKPLIDFFLNSFGFMSNNPKESTTKYGTMYIQ
jgi:hypothetical protein